MYIASDEATDIFLVEVSGWDSSDKFFVEHAVLSWDGEEGKEIALRSVVRPSDMVFVRLLQPVDGSENFPVACHVTKVSDRDVDGRLLVRVAESRPRAPYRETMGGGNTADDESAANQPSHEASQMEHGMTKSSRFLDPIPL